VPEPAAGVRAGTAAPATALALAVSAVAFAYFALFVHYGFNLDDEGALLAQFYRTYLGELPYRDFHMGYTPSGHYFQAGIFWLFGVSVVPLRWSLAACDSLVALLLFVIGRRIMPAGFALLAPLAYCAAMPFYPGEFASFNIPYPSWYGVLFWVGGLWMLLRFLESGRVRWVAASGLMAGFCFAFKPNVGLFQLASGGLVLLLVLEPPARGGSRWQGVLWWALAFGVTAGLAIVFASQASARDVRIFLLPIAAVLVTLAVRRAAGRSADAAPHGVLACGVAYAVAMLATVVPWVATFLHALGPQRFERQVLFIGTGFEEYYYLPFHWAGPWDRMLALGVLAVVGAGLLVRTRWLSPRLVLATVAAVVAIGVLALRRADMPEGLHAAVFTRLEDLSFTASLLVHWAALAVALPVLWKRTRSRAELTEAVILVSALAMYLQLYPRSDFMHLVAAGPLTLVLAAFLGARFATWFDVTPALGRTVRVVLVGGALGLIAFRISPNLGAVLTWDGGGPAWRMQAALGLERAPITLEVGRAPRLRELHDTVTYLRANTAPGEAIFPFPAIEMVCFLADRPNATRHGYFFPGWPGHEVEAEVVSSLRAAPPRLVVVAHGHQFFFVNAPAYYYALREFVQQRYRQVAAIGDFAVLARRDVPDDALYAPAGPVPRAAPALAARYEARLGSSPAERLAAAWALAAERLDFAWEPVLPLLEDPDLRIRAAAIRALANVTDSDVAVPLASALANDTVPRSLRKTVLRRIWAVGDVQAIEPLIEVLGQTVSQEERGTILGILDTLTYKLAISDYWFGEAPAFATTMRRLPHHRRWRRRLASPNEDMRLRLFLARLLPRLDDGALAPALYVALGSESPDLRGAAAAGLIRMRVRDRGLRLLETLLPLIPRDPTFAPSLLLELYHRDPERARRPLAETLENDLFPLDQIGVAWVVSATGDRRFRVPLINLLTSPIQELRLAALTGLERIGDPRTRPAIERALDDPEFLVRDFAERALAALPPQS